MMRFNTENKGSLFWRVIIEGKEHLADNVTFHVSTYTSQDKIAEGVTKFHISCRYNKLTWSGTNLIVE
jgi:hypothetical protein